MKMLLGKNIVITIKNKAIPNHTTDLLWWQRAEQALVCITNYTCYRDTPPHTVGMNWLEFQL